MELGSVVFDQESRTSTPCVGRILFLNARAHGVSLCVFFVGSPELETRVYAALRPNELQPPHDIVENALWYQVIRPPELPHNKPFAPTMSDFGTAAQRTTHHSRIECLVLDRPLTCPFQLQVFFFLSALWDYKPGFYATFGSRRNPAFP